MFEGLLRDFKVGVRGLARRPGFAVAAILTLALGIGANTAVFSVIQHVLLAPLPYREPDRAVVIWSKWRGFDKTWVSDAEAIDYKTRITAFTDAGAWSVPQVNLTGDGDPVRIGAAARDAQSLRRARRDAACRTSVHGRRGDCDAIDGRHPELRPVAAAIRRRTGRRPLDPGQRRRAAGRRRHAEELPAADRLRRRRRGADAALAAVSA